MSSEVQHPPSAGAMPRFGEVAILLGLLDASQVEHALDTQSRQRKMYEAAGASGRDLQVDRLGEICQRLGYLDEEGIRRILNRLADERRSAAEAVAASRCIGDFELLHKIGQGSMGTVYLVRQRSQDRLIALKILPPDLAHDLEFLERFRREARAAARLNHPHIVRAYDVGVASGYHYIAMEYVEGEDLERGLEQHPDKHYAPEEVLRAAKEIARALACAHAAGIVHRDIKPSNILRDKNGVFKLADLGLATPKGPDKRVTATGIAVGTPYYISPEQARGELNVDRRADIYSLGATLFHLATGRVPFPGDTAVIVMKKHIGEPLQAPIAVRASVPKGLSRLIEKMMAKQPEDRQQTAEEVLTDVSLVERGKVPLLKRARMTARSFLWESSAMDSPAPGAPVDAETAGHDGVMPTTGGPGRAVARPHLLRFLRRRRHRPINATKAWRRLPAHAREGLFWLFFVIVAVLVGVVLSFFLPK